MGGKKASPGCGCIAGPYVRVAAVKDSMRLLPLTAAHLSYSTTDHLLSGHRLPGPSAARVEPYAGCRRALPSHRTPRWHARRSKASYPRVIATGRTGRIPPSVSAADPVFDHRCEAKTGLTPPELYDDGLLGFKGFLDAPRVCPSRHMFVSSMTAPSRMQRARRWNMLAWHAS